MKKVLLITIIIAGVVACNKENDFPDHEYLNPDGSGTGKHYGVYFGTQYPVRTLVLGHERFPNPDADSLFHIGVSIGGMYKNTRNWKVDYVFDETLADSLIMGTTGTDNDTVMALPSEYFTINPVGSTTIPSGSFNGLIQIKLKKAFFEDPLAITKKYVVPLRITASEADTILSGRAKLGYDTDLRRAGDWDVLPKNYVLFAIKYINPYHGVYFHRGAVTDGVNPPLVYRNQYLERNATRNLITTGPHSITLNGIANNMAGAFKMELSFNGEDITITPSDGATYSVTGTGKFLDENHPNAEQISGVKYPTLYLDYSYVDGADIKTAKDTLVRRDRGVKYEFVSASAVVPFNVIPIK